MKLSCCLAILAAFLLSPNPLRAQTTLAPGSAAAEELLKSMRMEEMMAKMRVQQKEAIGKMMTGSLPQQLTPEQQAAAQTAQTKVFDYVSQELSWEKLRPDFVRAYSEVFSEAEMRELTAFYKTPIGMKFVEKTPELTSKVVEITQKRVMTLLPQIQKMATESMQAAPVKQAK